MGFIFGPGPAENSRSIRYFQLVASWSALMNFLLFWHRTPPACPSRGLVCFRPTGPLSVLMHAFSLSPLSGLPVITPAIVLSQPPCFRVGALPCRRVLIVVAFSPLVLSSCSREITALTLGIKFYIFIGKERWFNFKKMLIWRNVL